VVSSERVRQQLREVMGQEAWVLDGNFDSERELVWPQADCIIWLDYSWLTIFRRIAFRNFFWLITQQPTWSGNRMTLPRALSGICHTIKSYPNKRRHYPRKLAELTCVVSYRFHTNRETEAWLQHLNQQKIER
jgi:hypothetical protein